MVEKMNALQCPSVSRTQQRILAEALAQLAGARTGQPFQVLVVASAQLELRRRRHRGGQTGGQAFHRPAIVIGINDAETHGKGSARSIPGFDMFRGIQHCKDLLESCGGHEMAAGLSLTMDNLAAFDEKINAHAAGVLTPEDFVPRLTHDGDIDPSQLSLGLLEEWQQLAPFGEANPEPRFTSRELLICEARRIGKDLSHLKMRVRAEAMDPTDCVAWGFGDWTETGSAPATIWKPCTSPQINEWNGRRLLQFNIKDLRRPS